MSKQTHREQARDRNGFESSFSDPPTSPARADATRRRVSRDCTVVQCRYDYIREYEATKAEGEKKGESNATPNTTRYVRRERPPPTGSGDVPDGQCGSRSGGSRRDFSDAQPRSGVLSMPFTLVCITFTYLYFIFEYNATSLFMLLFFLGLFLIQCLSF